MKLSILLNLLIAPILSIYLKVPPLYIINKKNNYAKIIRYNKQPVITFYTIQNIKNTMFSLFNFSNFNDEHMKIIILLY